MRKGGKILVCGGRHYDDGDFLNSALNGLLREYEWFEALIEGGATGADRLARDWAMERGIPTVTFTANWKKWGLAAGIIRNKHMIDVMKPDMVIAFPGGRGTQHMSNYALSCGIKLLELRSEKRIVGNAQR